MKHMIRMFLVSLLLSGMSLANVIVTPIFSDNMVLQKTTRVPVWGTASPGESVTVVLDHVSAKTLADKDGRWRVTLNLAGVAPGPFNLTIAGKNKIVIRNVMVGQVWLGSGQSNMAKIVGPMPGQQPCLNWQAEVAKSGNPQIRVFTVMNRPGPYVGTWQVASPENTAMFTAVGYFFARELQQALHQPVGIINASVGGSHAEAWTSLDAMNAVPELKEVVARQIGRMETWNKQIASYPAAEAAWEKQTGLVELIKKDYSSDWAAAGVPLSDWTPVTLPASLGQLKLTPGIYWFRRDITIWPQHGNKGIDVRMTTVDYDTAFFNGRKIGETTAEKTTTTGSLRYYHIPASDVIEGKAPLAVRLIALSTDAGLLSGLNRVAMTEGGATVDDLSGPWYVKQESAFPRLSPEVMAARPALPKPPVPQYHPAEFFESRIAPLIPYALSGFLWYQGESNVERASTYEKQMAALIGDWRRRWAEGAKTDGPGFYFCQLANNYGKRLLPADSKWAELRQAQLKTLNVPNTGMAVLIDIGEGGDIHPVNKQEVGRRLALIALAKTYGQSVPCSGPLYKSHVVVGRKIRISFEHVNGGLEASPLPDVFKMKSYAAETLPLVKPSPNSRVQGFAIAGVDKRFVWAEAIIDGATVLVSAPEVASPRYVRYAWADNPTCNLYNKAGLPASPFTTDE